MSRSSLRCITDIGELPADGSGARSSLARSATSRPIPSPNPEEDRFRRLRRTGRVGPGPHVSARLAVRAPDRRSGEDSPLARFAGMAGGSARSNSALPAALSEPATPADVFFAIYGKIATAADLRRALWEMIGRLEPPTVLEAVYGEPFCHLLGCSGPPIPRLGSPSASGSSEEEAEAASPPLLIRHPSARARADRPARRPMLSLRGYHFPSTS